MKKMHKIIITIVIAMILAVLFAVRIRTVNQNYPEIVEYQYEIDEKFNWQDYDINVKGYQILTADEIKSKWPNCDISNISDSDVIIAELAVNYVGDEASAKFPLVNLRGQAGAWYNSSELSCLLEFNNGNTVCKKNETRTFYTAIGISHKQLSEAQVNEIKNGKIQLVFQTYSDVIYVNLEQ